MADLLSPQAEPPDEPNGASGKASMELEPEPEQLPQPEPELDAALAAAMERRGLTAEDRELLRREGVVSLRLFRLLADDDFVAVGIDIEARRLDQAAADEYAAETQTATEKRAAKAKAAAAAAQEVRDYVRQEAPGLGAAAVDTIVRGAGSMDKLEKLDVAKMKALGLTLIEARLLSNPLEARERERRSRQLESKRRMEEEELKALPTLEAWRRKKEELLQRDARRRAKKAERKTAPRGRCRLCNEPMPPGGRRRGCTVRPTHRLIRPRKPASQDIMCSGRQLAVRLRATRAAGGSGGGRGEENRPLRLVCPLQETAARRRQRAAVPGATLSPRLPCLWMDRS